MKKKVLITLLASLGGVLILAGLGIGVGIYQKKLNEQRAKDRVAAADIDTLKIGYDGASGGFYPNIPFEVVTYEFNGHVYEALTALDSVFQIKGQLAESWENPADNTWRFHLKQNVKFHDGSAMTANDVKASIELAISNENTNYMIPTVSEVTVVDDNTVDIITSAQTPLLANQLTTIYILPESLIASEDFDHPIGTAAYKYVSSDDNGVTLARFDDYYDTLPKAKNVILKSYSDYNERLTALKNGDVDVIQSVEDPDAVGVDKDGNTIKVAGSPGIGTIYLVLNTAADTLPYASGVTTNPFKDIRVRQAIQYALDPNALIETAGLNGKSAASQLVTPAIFGYNNEIKATTADIEKAKALMAEAGYANGFSVTLDMTDSDSFSQDLATALKEQFAAININLTVNLAPADESFFGKIMSDDTSMFYIQYDCATGDALEAFEALYGASPYFTIIEQDQDLSDVVAEIEQTFNSADRKTKLQQLASLADEAKLTIPLFEAKTYNAYRADIDYSARYDAQIYARDIWGAVPTNIQNDYSYLDTIKKILGFNV